MFDIPKWGDDVPKSNINFGKGNLKQKKKIKTLDITSSASSEVPNETKKNKNRKKKQNKDLQDNSFGNSNVFQVHPRQNVNLSVSKSKTKSRKNKIKSRENSNGTVTQKGPYNPMKTVKDNNVSATLSKENKVKKRKRKPSDSNASVKQTENNDMLSLKPKSKKKTKITSEIVDSTSIIPESMKNKSENLKPEHSTYSVQTGNNNKLPLKPKNRKKKKQNAEIVKDPPPTPDSSEIIKNKNKPLKRKHRNSNPNVSQDDSDGAIKPKKKKKNFELVEDTSAVSKSIKDNSLVKTDMTPVNPKISRKKEKLRILLQMSSNRSSHINVSSNNLRERMLDKLKAAQFRFLNEKLYTTSGSEAQKLFQSDPEAFHTYHQGYQQQVKKWPVNPLDVIVKSISKMPKTHVIADMGCGEAALSTRVQQNVRSFDLVSTKPEVEACDMAHTPLLAESVDVAVYCLALMGTELTQYLMEANRVLKMGGHLLIAEVESRFDKLETFTEVVQRLGFKLKNLDKSHQVFFFMEFTKVRDPPKKKSKLPSITLKPCLYKRR